MVSNIVSCSCGYVIQCSLKKQWKKPFASNNRGWLNQMTKDVYIEQQWSFGMNNRGNSRGREKKKLYCKLYELIKLFGMSTCVRLYREYKEQLYY